MRVGAYIEGDFGTEAATAVGLVANGFDPLWVAQTNNDAFLRALVAAGGAPRVQIGTGIAIAFSGLR